MSLILALPIGADGLIDPVVRQPHPTRQGESIFSHVSPYTVSLTALFEEFVFTPRRRELAAGLLNYRAALRAVEVKVGFQWIAGSFVEGGVDEPADLDLVSFYRPPPGVRSAEEMKAFADKHSHLFTKAETKAKFGCEPNFVLLTNAPERLAAATAYWAAVYSVSRRSQRQKGFVSVSFDKMEDERARSTLVRLSETSSSLPQRLCPPAE